MDASVHQGAIPPTAKTSWAANCENPANLSGPRTGADPLALAGVPVITRDTVRARSWGIEREARSCESFQVESTLILTIIDLNS